jgi:hypothetical protein
MLSKPLGKGVPYEKKSENKRGKIKILLFDCTHNHVEALRMVALQITKSSPR